VVGYIHYGAEQLQYYDLRAFVVMASKLILKTSKKAEMNLGSAGLTACATLK
jgi:hypothetical protein